ncbi:MAG: dicarboxylate/amino acid:cation symporter [Tistlia sp.]|uniref:dicarboxylate/amino acid:cation symporter n=1 Tax=Tistlia sp. TaxID=3057121 RepID=UPI0034A403C3
MSAETRPADEVLGGRSLVHQTPQLYGLIRSRLWAQVLAGLVLGILVGWLLGESEGWLDPVWAGRIAAWLAFPGHFFLAVIKFVVIPLVLASVVRGVAAGGDVGTLKRLGGRVVLIFLLMTVAAVALGLGLALWLRPGAGLEGVLLQPLAGAAPVLAQPADAVPLTERLIAILPQNPFAELAGGDMLQIVIGAGLVGAALLMVPRDQARPFFELMGSIQAACMVVVGWVMKIAPLAVFGLLCEISARVGVSAIVSVAAYVGTVLLGLLCLLLLFVAVVALLARRSPLAFLQAVREVALLAFSTSSSAAVMPLSLSTAETKLRVRSAVSRFVVPLGTTINMSGTALYQGVAALFLAQVYGVEIGLSGMLLIVVTAVGTSIGSPGTPGVGIVILATILEGVGIPAAGIALIIGVDRLLDMARTAVNVVGDLVACVLVERWLGVEAAQAAEALAPPPEPGPSG